VKIRLSKAADRDLAAILEYGIAHHGWPVAEAYARTLQRTIARLKDHPELSMLRTDLEPPLRSLSCGEHLIFYRTAPAPILIVRILHKAMDFHRHLKP
jgi:toxin ParE1/3/4